MKARQLYNYFVMQTERGGIYVYCRVMRLPLGRCFHVVHGEAWNGRRWLDLTNSNANAGKRYTDYRKACGVMRRAALRERR